MIRDAEIAGQGGLDVRIEGDRITALGPDVQRHAGEPCLEARGGALLPGLHDHHVHLLGLAAASESVLCGPPHVRDESALARVLAAARPTCGPKPWVRGVGYCESVAGALDRWRLDAMTGDTPVRIQHRSGALWILNSAGCQRLRLDAAAHVPGVETDARGRPNGRLLRLDDWLRERLPQRAPPDLRAVGQRLSRFGTTGVTDATPDNDLGVAELFAAALEEGALAQSIRLMGKLSLPVDLPGGIERGEVKILLDERDLPGFEVLAEALAQAHAGGRAAAVHCVTRTDLVFALEAFAHVGSIDGDRIEHASVAAPEQVARLKELGLCVVTQPHFIAERGDAYARDVDPRDRPWLYRGRGFLAAGVPLGAGTDAPFGDPDPWCAMRAAVLRQSPQGQTLGADEGLSPERALALFTTPATSPGACPRSLRTGPRANLCLLDRPWQSARERLRSEDVRATFWRGQQVFVRD